MLSWFRNSVVVDNWEEVCRENTDIEAMHMQYGLAKEEVFSILGVVQGHCTSLLKRESPVFFNPMGMAVFDIAIGNLYYQKHLVGIK